MRNRRDVWGAATYDRIIANGRGGKGDSTCRLVFSGGSTGASEEKKNRNRTIYFGKISLMERESER